MWIGVVDGWPLPLEWIPLQFHTWTVPFPISFECVCEPKTNSHINLITYFPGFIVGRFKNYIQPTTDATLLPPSPRSSLGCSAYPHSDMMNGWREREHGSMGVGAIDLIIILWHNYSIPSARSREFIRILLLLPVEIYLNGGGGGRRWRWMTSPSPWCEHYIATYGGGGRGSSSSSSAPHKGKQTPPLRDSSTEETSWNPSALDPH